MASATLLTTARCSRSACGARSARAASRLHSSCIELRVNISGYEPRTHIYIYIYIYTCESRFVAAFSIGFGSLSTSARLKYRVCWRGRVRPAACAPSRPPGRLGLGGCDGAAARFTHAPFGAEALTEVLKLLIVRVCRSWQLFCVCTNRWTLYSQRTNTAST